MRLRTAATLVATGALAAVLGVGVFVGTPVVALAFQPQPTAAASADPPPVQPSAVPTPSATASAERPVYSGPLIAPRGSIEITRQQLHEWVASRPFFGEDPQNDAIWEEQRWLVITCMARKGFLEDPTNPALADHQVSVEDGLTAEQAEAFFVAEWGPRTNAPYDWRTAGCDGRAVHLTGQDDAH